MGLRFPDRNANLPSMLMESGVRTELGILKRKQPDAAWRDYRRAAVLGNSQAQFFLAIHYAIGLDGHKNNLLASAWFKRAALRKEQLCELVSEEGDDSPEAQVRMFEKLYD